MRPETKLKLARRGHTQELLKLLYSTRDPQLDGTRLSMEYRAALEGDTRPLTYGEVHVPDFLAILELVKPKDGEIFVDLGSGTGKAVLAASCGFPAFSKCRGIELVPGLADAAANHLATAKDLLASPPAPVADVASSSSAADSKLRGEKILPLPGVSRKVFGADRTGKATSGSKGSKQGLSGCDLEALIADLLVRHSASSGSRGGGPEATAEDIAAWLVRELGHRRYKISLRGYGGFQKFLVARRGASDASARLRITEGGGMVSIGHIETCTPSGCHESTPQQGVFLSTDEETTRRREGVVGQESLPSRAVATAGAVTVAAVAAEAPDSGRPQVVDRESLANGPMLQSSACAVEAVSTAASSLTLSRSGSSCSEANVPDESRPTVTHLGTTGEDGDGDKSGIGGRSDINAERRRLQRGPLSVESLAGVELVCGDIFEESWDDADVVYVASLLFDNSIMARLAEYTQKLRKGARVISLKPIPAVESSRDTSLHNGLKLLHDCVFRMSWQMARVYIYETL